MIIINFISLVSVKSKFNKNYSMWEVEKFLFNNELEMEFSVANDDINQNKISDYFQLCTWSIENRL